MCLVAGKRIAWVSIDSNDNIRMGVWYFLVSLRNIQRQEPIVPPVFKLAETTVS